LTHSNADGAPFSAKGVIGGITCDYLSELAELREKAAWVCEETKSLIEESGRLRKRADELRAMPQTDSRPHGIQGTAAPTGRRSAERGLALGSHTELAMAMNSDCKELPTKEKAAIAATAINAAISAYSIAVTPRPSRNTRKPAKKSVVFNEAGLGMGVSYPLAQIALEELLIN